MVSSCVLTRSILSSFCLSKRRNRQQSPGLLIIKTASCWCVSCGLSLKPVSDNSKNRMGEKIKKDYAQWTVPLLPLIYKFPQGKKLLHFLFPT